MSLPWFYSSLNDSFFNAPEKVQQVCFSLHVHTGDRRAVDTQVQWQSKAGWDDVCLFQEKDTLCESFVNSSWQHSQQLNEVGQGDIILFQPLQVFQGEQVKIVAKEFQRQKTAGCHCTEVYLWGK